MDIKAVLARNVKALMALSDDFKTPRKLAPRCTTATREVGARTIAHILDPNSKVQPQLDTIVAIAEAFRVAPWLLLTPNFDATKKTGGIQPSSQIIALAERASQLITAMTEVFGTEIIPDTKPRGNGWDGIERRVHDPDGIFNDIGIPTTMQQPKPQQYFERAAKRKR